jgi:hypothetical protein
MPSEAVQICHRGEERDFYQSERQDGVEDNANYSGNQS